MKIHPTATVSPEATIHETVEIGPNVIIEDEVQIGARTRILANSVIRKYTTIGEDNEIHYGAIIGHDPQDSKFDPGVRSYVEIGDRNRIREYVTIHRGSKEGGRTVVGNENFLFAQSHLAHDVRIGDNVVIANSAALGGHSRVDDRAFLSGGVMIHQFVRVGRLVMVSGNSAFSRNIPPFLTALGQNLVVTLNVVGIRRAGISKKSLHEIRGAYDILFHEEGTLSERVARIEGAGFSAPEVQEIVDFVKTSERPIVYHAKTQIKSYNFSELRNLSAE